MCTNIQSLNSSYERSSQNNLLNYSSRQRKQREESNIRVSETDYKTVPKIKPSLCSYRDNCGAKLNLSEYFNRRNIKFRQNVKQRVNFKSRKQSRVNSKRTERRAQIDNSESIFNQRNRSSYSKRRVSILAHPYIESTNKFFQRLGVIIDQTMSSHHSNVNFERKVSFGSNQQGDLSKNQQNLTLLDVINTRDEKVKTKRNCLFQRRNITK